MREGVLAGNSGELVFDHDPINGAQKSLLAIYFYEK